MLTCKRLFSSFAFLSICVLVFSQNNTNSPYTQYGYGKLADQTFGQAQSMGGIGYGLRTSGQINPLNPASYSMVDSLTFLFDFGLTAEKNWLSDGENSQSNYNGNFSYLAMQFRLMKGLGVSIGLKPYSFVGYNYGSVTAIDNSYFQVAYNGTGALTQVYGGLGYELIKNTLSIGVNAGYTFGSINRNIYLAFPELTSATSVVQTHKVEARDFHWEVGLQYSTFIGKKDRLTIGSIFSPKQNFSAGNDLVRNNETVPFNQNLQIPLNIGGGFSYVKGSQLTFGGDVLYQNWSDVSYPFSGKDLNGKDPSFNDRMKYSFGIEYVADPSYITRNYTKRIRYRLGGYYSDSYINANDSKINEYGATVGIGFPFRLRGKESMVNIGAEYIKISPQKELIDEQYFKLTLGITFSETWFRKYKFD